MSQYTIEKIEHTHWYICKKSIRIWHTSEDNTECSSICIDSSLERNYDSIVFICCIDRLANWYEYQRFSRMILTEYCDTSTYPTMTIEIDFHRDYWDKRSISLFLICVLLRYTILLIWMVRTMMSVIIHIDQYNMVIFPTNGNSIFWTILIETRSVCSSHGRRIRDPSTIGIFVSVLIRPS